MGEKNWLNFCAKIAIERHPHFFNFVENKSATSLTTTLGRAQGRLTSPSAVCADGSECALRTAKGRRKRRSAQAGSSLVSQMCPSIADKSASQKA